MKKVLKFSTGEEVPEGAEYLNTIHYETIRANSRFLETVTQHIAHYFLVEIKEEENK